MTKTQLLFNLFMIVFLAFNAGTFPLLEQPTRAKLYLSGAFLVAGITAWKLWGSLL